MKKKDVSVIITDLDDTLWDWVGIWCSSFKAMLDKLIEISGLNREQLLPEFKSIYSKYGTTEYSFVLQELPSLLKKHTSDQIPTIYADAIDAFRLARQEAMKLYPDVMETLEQIKDSGSIIIGYTESFAFYTCYRLKKLGLDRIIDYLYSPADHDLPNTINRNDIRKYSPDYYKLRRTVHKHTPRGVEKPCPEVLIKILNDIGAKPEEAIYIGDKLIKDISMAHAANISDVHAAYGEAHNREEYELLKSVTHWTDSAVKEEIDATTEIIKPSYILKNSIKELVGQGPTLQENWIPAFAGMTL